MDPGVAEGVEEPPGRPGRPVPDRIDTNRILRPVLQAPTGGVPAVEDGHGIPSPGQSPGNRLGVEFGAPYFVRGVLMDDVEDAHRNSDINIAALQAGDKHGAHLRQKGTS